MGKNLGLEFDKAATRPSHADDVRHWQEAERNMRQIDRAEQTRIWQEAGRNTGPVKTVPLGTGRK